MDLDEITQDINSHAISIDAQLNAEDARQIIGEEIRRHEALVLTLKSQWNTLAPISKLPPEIFCRILSFVQWAPAKYGFESLKEAQCRAITWIMVTHVCRHWRSVALNAPVLWANPPLMLPKWAAEMLERSRMTGLTLVIDCKVDLDAIFASLQHANRVEFWDIEQTGNVLRLIFDGLSKTAPLLEALHINRVMEIHGRPEDQYAKIPPTLFREASRLRVLRLKQVDIEWNSHLFNRLTDLALSQISSDARPTWVEFKDILDKLPFLESMRLEQALPMSYGSCDEPTHLAHLQTMVIQSPAREIKSLFHHVTFPRLKRVEIVSLGDDSHTVDHASVLFAFLRSCSAKDLGDDARCLHVHQHESTAPGLSFQVYRNLYEYFEMYFEQSDLDLSFCAPDYDSDDLSDQIVTDVFKALQFVNLERLYLDQDILISPGALRRTFGSLPQLHSVFISDPHAKDFIASLHIVAEGRDSGPTPFPGLVSLTMDHVSFNPYNLDDLQIEEVQNCLMNRYEYGAAIQRLHINHCRKVTAEDVSLLEEIVVEVDWDVDEDDYETTEDEFNDSFSGDEGDDDDNEDDDEDEDDIDDKDEDGEDDNDDDDDDVDVDAF